MKKDDLPELHIQFWPPKFAARGKEAIEALNRRFLLIGIGVLLVGAASLMLVRIAYGLIRLGFP